jgi:Hint domain
MDGTKRDREGKRFTLRHELIALIGTVATGSVAAVLLSPDDRTHPTVGGPTSFREPQVSTIANPRHPHHAIIEEAPEPLRNSEPATTVVSPPRGADSGAQFTNAVPRTVLGAESDTRAPAGWTAAPASAVWPATPASAALNVAAAPTAVAVAGDAVRTQTYSIATTTSRTASVGFAVGPSAGTTTSLSESPSSGPARPLTRSIAAVVPSAVTIEEQPASASCFRSGTRILTTRGEVVVEELAPGDRAVSPEGVDFAVKWVGWRHLDISRSVERQTLLPVRIQRDAIAQGVPRRDLFISPGHGIYLDGMLIPAAALVNGATITQSQDIEEITYYHVELEAHGILLAEGAPVESYIDDGNRAFFANAGECATPAPVLAARPASHRWLPQRLRRALAPLGFIRRRHAAARRAKTVEGVRRRLATRAQALRDRRKRDHDNTGVAG